MTASTPAQAAISSESSRKARMRETGEAVTSMFLLSQKWRAVTSHDQHKKAQSAAPFHPEGRGLIFPLGQVHTFGTGQGDRLSFVDRDDLIDSGQFENPLVVIANPVRRQLFALALGAD